MRNDGSPNGQTFIEVSFSKRSDLYAPWKPNIFREWQVTQLRIVNTYSKICSEVLTYICLQLSPLWNVVNGYFTVNSFDCIQVWYIWGWKKKNNQCLLSANFKSAKSSRAKHEFCLSQNYSLSHDFCLAGNSSWGEENKCLDSYEELIVLRVHSCSV